MLSLSLTIEAHLYQGITEAAQIKKKEISKERKETAKQYFKIGIEGIHAINIIISTANGIKQLRAPAEPLKSDKDSSGGGNNESGKGSSPESDNKSQDNNKPATQSKPEAKTESKSYCVIM